MNARKRRIEAEQRLYNIQQGKVQKPDVYGSRKKPPVVKNNDQDDEFFENVNDDNLVINSDAVSAADILPNNNTVTDRELQQAFTSGSWRKFHIIGALDDEYVLMKTADYRNMIDHAKQQCPLEADNNKFKDIVTCDEKFNQVSVIKQALMEACHFNEPNISQLVSSGLLIPHHIQMDVYWFSIHNQGSFMSSLSNGRLQILRILKRRSTKDIMEKLLKQKKLNKSSFSIEFLLHDLIGSGRVER
ncbi:hypothetical protein HMPREF1544_07073 [Mucor circinelloides 1006PhL]|uniref:Uncharacterized protein n=1 Tax=Mucor circinelloides f. circinelloides (strain 1006PhL) TaxID=1220926 RepID=S2J7Q0_MUCC1|nr:hypothetical protein HMPREF1544_07073 [Mucor circinelloides 1006PhL]